MGAVRDYLFGTGEDRLDQGQMDSLDLLAQQTSWRMSELADALRVDPSTATRAVQRLVNVGLATRRPSGDDGRVVMVEITDAGRERHADVARRRMVLMGHMLKAFLPSERPVLADMLERFIAAVDDFVADVAVVT
jgi:DNA-binding MarR family transcriptional regulator